MQTTIRKIRSGVRKCTVDVRSVSSEEVGVAQFRFRSGRRLDDVESCHESKSITASACAGEALKRQERLKRPGGDRQMSWDVGSLDSSLE